MFPLAKTIGSVKKAHLIGIMLTCAGLAILVVLILVGAVTWVTATFVNFQWQWLDTTVNFFAGALTGIGGWFMLPALIVLIAGIFQETTIHRVEKTYYPDRVRTDEPGFWPDLAHDIKFTIQAVGLNVLILPLYLVGIGFIASIILNSYLLGREFFESTAGYHLGKGNAKTLIADNKFPVYGGGFVITLFTLVPIVNLFVPICAIVWMVHVYHKLPRS